MSLQPWINPNPKFLYILPLPGFVTGINVVPGAFNAQPRDVGGELESVGSICIWIGGSFWKRWTHVKKGNCVDSSIPEISSETLTRDSVYGGAVNQWRLGKNHVHADLKTESKESLLVPGCLLKQKSKLILKEVCQSHKQQWLSSEWQMYVLVA